jgi:2,4-dichlorophenol 6-monooxygenase
MTTPPNGHLVAETDVLVVGSGPAGASDPELYAQPTTWPGAKLPHTWVTERGRRISTLDLAGHGRFAVVTGIGGEAWLDAAAGLADHFGLTITPVSIGPGQPYEDPYGTWADLREIDDGGVLLVRPDLYIAARHLACPASLVEAREWLARVLSSILGPVPSHGGG